jgi:hypothetical protein
MSRMKPRYDLDAMTDFINKFKGKNEEKRVVKTKTIDKSKIVQAEIIAKTVGISAFISIIVFLMIQVIWADAISTALPEIVTVSQSMFWVELLLLTGLFTALGISMIVFIIYGTQKDVTGETKGMSKQMIKSALISALVTFLVLVVISFIAVFVYDPGVFAGLTFIDYFGVFFEVIAYFVVYVYPDPAGFWTLTILMYYVILTVLFVLIVSRSKHLDGRRMQKKADSIRASMKNRKPIRCDDRIMAYRNKILS